MYTNSRRRGRPQLSSNAVAVHQRRRCAPIAAAASPDDIIGTAPRAMPLHRLSARRLWRASQGGGRVRARARCCGPRRICDEQRGAATFVALASVDRGQLVVLRFFVLSVKPSAQSQPNACGSFESLSPHAATVPCRHSPSRRPSASATAASAGVVLPDLNHVRPVPFDSKPEL